MSRREFVKRNVAFPAGIGLGLLAASCARFAPRDPEDGSASSGANAADSQASKPAPTIADIAVTNAVKPPAHEPLPGVYASCGLETVYCVRCGKRAVLVDTGFEHTFASHLDNFEKAGVDLRTIAAVLTTHFHVDHTAALGDARKRLHCPIIAHKNNAEVFETADRFATAAHMPYLGWDLPFQRCRVDHIVEDGDTITVGPTTFTVVHLPGHTPGCTGYLFGDGWLFVGDVVFPTGILGWNDVHWGSNYLDVIDTMRRLAVVSPKMCLPSHGLPWPYDPSTSTGGEARAKAMLEDFRAGPMGITHRAPLADKTRTPQSFVLGRG